MESYTLVAFIVALMFGNGMALKCRNCLSRESFDECEKMGPIAECNATIVNANHETFKSDNPTLQQGNGTEFKCYRLEVARLGVNNTDTGLRGYARGCTFVNTSFCNGWNANLNLTSCSTCTTDNCDQNAPEITTVPPQNSTSPSGQVSTTTKKPNSAGALTFSSLTSLGCLSILLAFTAL